MTDPSDSPHDPADARDERIAARLQTEPLDELTRARLVRNALDASPPKVESPPWWQRAQWIGAAALALVVVVAIVAIARNPRTENATFNEAGPRLDSKAVPAPESAPAPSAAADTTETNRGTDQRSQTFVERLGDVGEIGDAAVLRQRVAPERGGGSTLASPINSPPRCSPAAVAAFPAGAVTGDGIGTVEGQPVDVFVVERPNGERAAVLVSTACAVLRIVAL